jgi:polar amino acid transport system substrate-binding protein
LTLALVAALVPAALVAGCGGTTTTGAKVTTLKRGILMMGSDIPYPPFEFKEGDKVVGFDVDIATEIAKRLNVKLDVVPTKWDVIISRLISDKYDIIMSAMPITPERSKEISFSDPYIDSDQSIAVKIGSPIKTEADLKDKVIGVWIDTPGQMTAEKMTGLKEIREFDNIQLAFEALETGSIDAIINYYPINSYMSKKSGKTVVVQKIITNEKYGIGVKKDNSQLRLAINNELRKLKEDGTYNTIYKKWFGTSKTT